MLVGSFIGNVLGLLTGLNSDIGGVGFAMLLLLVVTNSKKLSAKIPEGYEKGLNFWQTMFIPVIIAMTASQNVVKALDGGILALAAGLAATDPSLVPYGAMTATFYTGLGCLLCPSVMYGLVNLIL